MSGNGHFLRVDEQEKARVVALRAGSGTEWLFRQYYVIEPFVETRIPGAGTAKSKTAFPMPAAGRACHLEPDFAHSVDHRHSLAVGVHGGLPLRGKYEYLKWKYFYLQRFTRPHAVGTLANDRDQQGPMRRTALQLLGCGVQYYRGMTDYFQL